VSGFLYLEPLYQNGRVEKNILMSTIENLKFIQENGMDAFLTKEETTWHCPECNGQICCHNGLCLSYNLDKLRLNRKYRWDEE